MAVCLSNKNEKKNDCEFCNTKHPPHFTPALQMSALKKYLLLNRAKNMYFLIVILFNMYKGIMLVVLAAAAQQIILIFKNNNIFLKMRP